MNVGKRIRMEKGNRRQRTEDGRHSSHAAIQFTRSSFTLSLPSVTSESGILSEPGQIQKQQPHPRPVTLLLLATGLDAPRNDPLLSNHNGPAAQPMALFFLFHIPPRQKGQSPATTLLMVPQSPWT
jgi:hypothetical protein